MGISGDVGSAQPSEENEAQGIVSRSRPSRGRNASAVIAASAVGVSSFAFATWMYFSRDNGPLYNEGSVTVISAPENLDKQGSAPESPSLERPTDPSDSNSSSDGDIKGILSGKSNTVPDAKRSVEPSGSEYSYDISPLTQEDITQIMVDLYGPIAKAMNSEGNEFIGVLAPVAPFTVYARAEPDTELRTVFLQVSDALMSTSLKNGSDPTSREFSSLAVSMDPDQLFELLRQIGFNDTDAGEYMSAFYVQIGLSLGRGERNVAFPFPEVFLQQMERFKMEYPYSVFEWSSECVTAPSGERFLMPDVQVVPDLFPGSRPRIQIGAVDNQDHLVNFQPERRVTRYNRSDPRLNSAQMRANPSVNRVHI